MTMKIAAAELITEARKLVTSIEPLFYSILKTAEHHGLDEVRISTARAREIQRDLFVLKKKLKDSIPLNDCRTTTDQHLDRVFGL